jgi:RNA polymerase sigma-70 factor (ECF subfamily)
MDDRLVLERIRNGDIEAFSLLVEKYHKALLTFIYRFVGDERVVEDIGQEVFLDVYRSLTHFDEKRGAPFSAWLIVAARNRCISELRKRGGRRSVSFDEIEDTASDLKSAETLLIEHERQQAVIASLGELTEPYRRTLVMSLRGSSIKEIANTFGILPGTAKSRLCRARERMKSLVQEYLGGKAYGRI